MKLVTISCINAAAVQIWFEEKRQHTEVYKLYTREKKNMEKITIHVWEGTFTW